MSLGRAWVHKLIPKLDAAAAASLSGIEIFYEDLEYLAREQSSPPLPNSFSPPAEAQLAAAHTIKKLCDERGLTIICLQPFMFYEGLVDRKEHEARIGQLKLWFEIVKVLGTDIIQIPGNFLPAEQITSDLDVVVMDLQEVADMGLQQSPVVRFAYENLCFSTFFDTWDKGWEIVEKVDRPNFGLCLDTFNIAGRVWADPTVEDGKMPNADEALKKSLEKMVEKIDVQKVFYIQVVDAEKMREPLVEGHAFYAENQPARMSWSRNARLFAFEEGGYLPVSDVLKAIIVGLGYTGWVSMELFSRTMNDPAEQVPREHARRAGEAWLKVDKEIKSWVK